MTFNRIEIHGNSRNCLAHFLPHKDERQPSHLEFITLQERHFRCEVTRNKSSNYRKMLSFSSPSSCQLLCFCHKTDKPRINKQFGLVILVTYIFNENDIGQYSMRFESM